jgi:hypothetical protein
MEFGEESRSTLRFWSVAREFNENKSIDKIEASVVRAAIGDGLREPQIQDPGRLMAGSIELQLADFLLLILRPRLRGLG